MPFVPQGSVAVCHNVQSLTGVKDLSLRYARKCSVHCCSHNQACVTLLHNKQVTDKSLQELPILAAKDAFSSCCWNQACILLPASCTPQLMLMHIACTLHTDAACALKQPVYIGLPLLHWQHASLHPADDT